MKYTLIFLVLLMATIPVNAQERTSAAESVDNIKLQLIEVQAKEEMAKLRVKELDEALKPENIERALAGIGSTRPEELREQRRRQLMIERTAAQSKTEQLALQRSRLESALVTAEANAYVVSAEGPKIENAGILSIAPRGLRLMGVVGVLAIILVGGVLVRWRRQRVS